MEKWRGQPIKSTHGVFGNARVQRLARAAQQGAVGGVLDQRVLELIFGGRRGAALEDQPSRD
jgi:hypothetical protein